MEEIENITKDIKFYSSKSISTATFIGGPLAAGYLINENFKALNKPEEGRKYLIIGIITTIVLFGGMFLLPEKTVDKIPKQLIPLIYTGLIWGFVEWTQGDILKLHKENGNPFFSGWKSAGIGLISLTIIVLGIFGYSYFESKNPIYKIYEEEMSEFLKNENESLTLYNNSKTNNDSLTIINLNKSIIPKWRKNILIIKKLGSNEKLTSELENQNKLLLEYSKLRLENFILIKKTLEEKTNKHYLRINTINSKLEKLIEKLK
jgi:hypothetical protein